MKKTEKWKWVAIAAAACFAGIFYLHREDHAAVEYAAETYEQLEDEEESLGGTGEVNEESSKTEVFYVQICGQVNAPGVYQVYEGTRIYQVVDMAGGMTAEASVTAVNQAAEVSDGQQIYIPARGETEAQSVSDGKALGEQPGKNLVNINQASKQELMELPGIGETKAEAIKTYREENGGFSAIEDIMKVAGIKDAAFQKIKDFICV